MRKATALSGIFVFSIITAVMAYASPANLAEAKAEAAKLNKPLLLEFSTEW